MKHTDEPLKVIAAEGCYRIFTESGELIAKVEGGNRETDEANANLFAAAPKLLDALRFALFTIEHRPGLSHRMDLFTTDERNTLRNAIAAAEGR